MKFLRSFPKTGHKRHIAAGLLLMGSNDHHIAEEVGCICHQPIRRRLIPGARRNTASDNVMERGDKKKLMTEKVKVGGVSALPTA